MVVAGQHHVRAGQPLLLKRGQFDLDHHHAQPGTVGIVDGVGQEVAGHAGGHADTVEASLALGHALQVIRAVAVVFADVAGRLVPVAGRDRHAIARHQGQRGRTGYLVGLRELQVEPLAARRIRPRAQRGHQVGVQRHHLWQRTEAIDALLQALRVQLQLPLHLHAFTGERALAGEMAGRHRAQHGAAHHHQQGAQQLAIAAQPIHPTSLPPGRAMTGPEDGRPSAVSGHQKCICARTSKISGLLRTPPRLASTFT